MPRFIVQRSGRPETKRTIEAPMESFAAALFGVSLFPGRPNAEVHAIRDRERDGNDENGWHAFDVGLVAKDGRLVCEKSVEVRRV